MRQVRHLPARTGPQAPLRSGRTPAGHSHGLPTGVDTLAPTTVPDELLVGVSLGPRDDWFPDAAGQLNAGRWRVSDRSNRVGLRLAGTALERTHCLRGRELASEGLLTGAVQVPPDGQPVVFLADHPTTGGYPVIAVVPPDTLWTLAQARPGTPVRFRTQR